MGTFQPSVQCRGTFPHPASCDHVLAAMPASTGLDVFGPADTPHVKEILPQALLSRKHSDSPTILGYSDGKWHSADEKCMVRMFSTGQSDLLSWYRVWESVEAIFAVCARNHHGGITKGLGEFSLYVT